MLLAALRPLGRSGPWPRDFCRIVSWNIERGLQLPKILEFLGRH